MKRIEFRIESDALKSSSDINDPLMNYVLYQLMAIYLLLNLLCTSLTVNSDPQRGTPEFFNGDPPVKKLTKFCMEKQKILSKKITQGPRGIENH